MNSKSSNHGLALLGCGISLAAMITLNLVGYGNQTAVWFGWPFEYLLREQTGFYDRYPWGDGTWLRFSPWMLVVNIGISFLIIPGLFQAIRRVLDVRFSITTLLAVTAASGIWLKSSVQHQIDFPFDSFNWARFASRLSVLASLFLACLGYVTWVGKFRPSTIDAPGPSGPPRNYLFACFVSSLAIASLMGLYCIGPNYHDSVGGLHGWPLLFAFRDNRGYIWDGRPIGSIHWMELSVDLVVGAAIALGVCWRIRGKRSPRDGVPFAIATAATGTLWLVMGSLSNLYDDRAYESALLFLCRAVVFCSLVLGIQGYFRMVGDILTWRKQKPRRFPKELTLKLPFLSLIIAFVVCANLVAAKAADVIPHAQDKPPGPALSPQEAIKKMTVPEGFSVELVASEPDIVNPIAMAIDERGRFWITESLEYPRRSAGAGKDRVKVLEDTDGDGKADKFTVFADGLNIPSGIAVGHGGIWVANSPDILFMQDTDGDGKADKSEVVVTGFGRDDTHELPNSLTWGPDGYLYGLNGVFNYSNVKYPKSSPNYKEGQPGWQFTCALFRIHPVTKKFEVFCEGTSNPWGVAFDPEGSAFISACVIDHLWHLTETGYYHRQGGPYPPFTWKIESIVKHKHQKAAYCGITYFDSDAYPEKYRDKLYMGNIHGGCINVDKLQRDGSTYFATPEPDFLTANDAWFMPVVQKTGPDGSLYILDWYDRYHCYQDANRDPAGIDRLKGRLYRVRYKETPRVARDFDLGKDTDEELIERLGAKNDFIRATAQRLIIERTYESALSGKLRPLIPGGLWGLVVERETPIKTRMAALFALIGGNPLDEAEYDSLLNHRLPEVRAIAVRAAGNQRTISDKARHNISVNLAIDPSPDVRLQVAIAARKIKGIDAFSVLFRVLNSSGDDKLIPHIVWQNLHPLLEENPAPFLTAAKSPEFLSSPHAREFLPRAAERILGRKKFEADAVAGLVLLTRDAAPKVAQELLALLSTKVQSGEIRGKQLEELKTALAESVKPLLADPALHPAGDEAALLAASWGDERGLKRARQTFSVNGLQNDYRIRGLAALISGGDKELLPLVEKALTGNVSPVQDPADFRGKLLAMLGKLDDPKIADIVLTSYAKLEPEAKPKAIQLLTQRTIWANKLVTAIGDKKIPAEALNVNQVRQLLSLNDKELTSAVAKHWGTVRTTRDPQREEIVAQMKQLIRKTPGDAKRGIAVYTKVCGQCHKMYGEGQEVGPDITLNGRSSFDQLLSNVFDPSLVIGASYQARLVKTTDGRVLTGLLAEDSPQRVVLKVQGGKQEIIPRSDVEMMKISELSLMPQDVEKTLKPEEIADLFAYITLDKPPSDPSAKLIPGTKEGK